MNDIIDNAHDGRCKSADKVIGALGNSLEDGLHVIGRTGDHLQDFRSRGLPLQRFPGLVEQPRVLDCDHRLIGEGRQQIDLLVIERTHFGTAQQDRADALVATQQGHGQNGMNNRARCFGPYGSGIRKPGAFLGHHVMHVNGLLVDKRASSGPIAADRPFVDLYGDGTGMRAEAQMFLVFQQYDCIVGFAKFSAARFPRSP